MTPRNLHRALRHQCLSSLKFQVLGSLLKLNLASSSRDQKTKNRTPKLCDYLIRLLSYQANYFLPQNQNRPSPKTDDTSSLASQLWTQAYDEVKSDNEKLVDEYETIILRTAFQDESTLQDEGARDCQIGVAQKRTRMVQAVEAGLKKTEEEAALKQQVQEGIRIVTSVKEFVGKALKNAPEAAAAWGGVCLLLQVGFRLSSFVFRMSNVECRMSIRPIDLTNFYIGP